MKLYDKLKEIPYYKKLKELERELNVNLFLVGGTVRDLILNRELSDLDLIVFGINYEDFAIKFAEEIKGVAIHFKDNVRVVKNNFIIDVSKVRGDTLEEDLMKRDFTINNLAVNLSGELFGDTADIEEGKIRAITEENILDDPLRIFRAFRFLSELGFDITDDTFDLINKHKGKLINVANERIYNELKKMILGKHFLSAFDLMKESGLWEIIIPELINLKGKDKGIYHSHDPYEHTFCAAKSTYLEAKRKNLNDHDLFIIFIASLLHDIAKGLPEYENTKGKYIGHEEKGAKLASKILKRLSFSSKDIKLIKVIIENHTRIRIYAVNNAKEKTIKKFIFEFNHLLNLLYIITIGDNACKPINLDKILKLIAYIEKVRKQLNFEKSNLINGDDLIRLGCKPSAQFKKILKDVKFKLANNELKDKDDALKYIYLNYKDICQ